MNTSSPLGVVIVTHNHRSTIETTLASIERQTEPADHVVVVDCGSADVEWMKPLRDRPRFELISLESNAGFAGGNNEGWRRLRQSEELVLFLNPDVVAPPELFGRLRALMTEPRASSFAAVSPRLVQWDFFRHRATGAVDSTGVFPHRLGTWRDRRESSPPAGDLLEEIPALCGAFFLGRASALQSVQLSDGTLWDERYFAYKEDIELSLRLRRAGFRLGVWHGAEAGHGRGWTNRAQMSRHARLLSARNELRLHATYAKWRWPMSLAKWLYVRWLER